MAEGDDQSVEDMVKKVQLLELQAKRMEQLVNQQRNERLDMEAENARIKCQLRCYMEEMAKENKEAKKGTSRHRRRRRTRPPPSLAVGVSLTSASSEPAPAPRAVSHAHWSPVVVDPAKPSGNIQVTTITTTRGEEIGGILVRDFALSSWGMQREKAHGDTTERPKS